MMLWSYIKEKMLSYPDQKICENNAKMSFEDLAVWSELFARKLKGVECCAILCRSEMAAAMSLLACFAANVTAVPLSIRYGEHHCQKILDMIRPDAVITDDCEEIRVLKIQGSGYIPPQQHPALIMCTSGTTGKPKGAMLSEKNILTNMKDIASYFAMDATDEILISRPIYHCAVLVGEFLVALMKGTAIRFYSGKFNPTKMLELIRQYNITVFCGTPTLLSMMARFVRTPAHYPLHHICISGECMDRETGLYIAEAFPQSQIYHVYGLTEASPRVSYLPPNFFKKYPDCVGVPLHSVCLKILTPSGMPCKENEEGILWVKGESIMLGYYKDKKRSNRVLKDGWLCTGDLALLNEFGMLKIKGRSDDLIIKAGMNIYPQEIENALKRDRRVHEVSVYGQTDKKAGTQIVLNVAGDFSDTAEIKELCRRYLPSYQMPAQINLLKEIPKNGSGKIIRRASHVRA